MLCKKLENLTTPLQNPDATPTCSLADLQSCLSKLKSPHQQDALGQSTSRKSPQKSGGRVAETDVIHSPTRRLGWNGRRAHRWLGVTAAHAAAVASRRIQRPVGAGKPCRRLLQLRRPICALLHKGAVRRRRYACVEILEGQQKVLR